MAWPAARTSASSTACASPDRKSTRLNSSHLVISYAVFCLKKKNYLLLFSIPLTSELYVFVLLFAILALFPLTLPRLPLTHTNLTYHVFVLLVIIVSACPPT